MSLFNRRSLLALPLALAACGFTPVYGPQGAGSKLHSQVLVQEPSTQAGYLLVRHLETQLGRSGATARYAPWIWVSPPRKKGWRSTPLAIRGGTILSAAPPIACATRPQALS